MAELTIDQKRALATARARQRLTAEEPRNVEYGTLWPIRHDSEGSHFDSDAGLMGAAKRLVNLPGQAMRGEVDPMSDEGIDRAIEASMFMTPGSVATRAGVGIMGAPITKKATVAAPTAKALTDAADAGFDAMRNTGAKYSSNAVKQMANGVRANLEEKGILQELAPQSYAILKKLQAPPKDSIATIQGLAAARMALRNARKNFNNPTDQLAAGHILNGLDEFLNAAGQGSTLAGPVAAQKAARLLKESNANYAAAKRSSQLTGVDRAADLRAHAANSGQNTGNAIRSRIASVLLDPKKAAGYSPKELKALEGVVKGSRAANTTRRFGNILGGGGGLGSMVSGGAGSIPGFMLGSPELSLAGAFATPIAGHALKSTSNKLTRGALRQADDLVRMRSPVAAAQQAAAPVVQTNPALRQALVKALMLQQQRMQGQSMGDLNQEVVY